MAFACLNYRKSGLVCQEKLSQFFQSLLLFSVNSKFMWLMNTSMDERTIKAGDFISIDSSSDTVYLGSEAE